MSADIQATSGSKKMYWAGWVMGVLPALMMLMSAGMKLSQSPMVLEGFAKMGFPEGTAVQLGIPLRVAVGDVSDQRGHAIRLANPEIRTILGGCDGRQFEQG